MGLTHGTRLGPYEILSPLGAGGMGEVYRARDARLGREVAVKVLPREFSRDPERMARFEREAKALAALSHPNVLAIYDVGSHDGTPFVVMELLEGETLGRRIPSKGLTLPQSLDIASAILRGLAAAHQRGLVHRDLKPDNVFISPDGHVKLLDFGLARLSAEPVGTEDLTTGATMSGGTSPGVVLGTLAYMSPEQARGLPVDHRTDLFAFGCLLYEMLSGRKAFPGDTPADTLSAILLREPEPASGPEGPLPAWVQDLLRRCLAKSPEDRFASAQEVALALQSGGTGGSPLVLSEDGPGGTGSFSPSTGTSASGKRGLSIVVLPFTDLSPGKDNEYFSDGLTEEILGDLSKISSLRVISRTSSMALKETRKDLQTIASELGVRYVLEGSVRRAGNALRISAQLIDAATDAHLWAEKYSGTLDDVFDIQEKVSRAITEALKVKLSPSEERLIAARPMPSIQAYDCLLKARRAMHLLTPEGISEAGRLLQEGLDIAGENALLLAGMARVQFEMVDQCMQGPEGLPKAETYARRALELDPETAAAHLTLGLVAHFRGDLAACLRSVRRALAIDPNDADTLWWMTWFTAWNAGRPELARPYALRQVELDPASPLSHLSLAYVDFCAGKHEVALSRLRAAFPTMDVPIFRITTAALLIYAQQFHEALSLLEPVEPIPEYNFMWGWGFLLKVALEGDRSRLPEALRPDLIALGEMDPCVAYIIAHALARLDLRQEALDWLEKAVSRGYYNYPMMDRFDPFIVLLKGEPRYERVLQQAKVEWERLESVLAQMKGIR